MPFFTPNELTTLTPEQKFDVDKWRDIGRDLERMKEEGEA